MITGNIDKLDKKRISGWAWDPARPYDILEITVFNAGRAHAAGPASLFRADLASQKPDGKIAFQFNFPELENLDNIAIIAMDSQGTKTALPWQGKPMDLRDPDSLQKEDETNIMMWGTWPLIEDYSHLSSAQLDGPVGGNVGNLAFISAVSRQMDIKPGKPWYSSFSEKGTAVIPVANQLGKHADMGNFAKRVRESNCRVMAIGLGAQAHSYDEIPEIPDGTLEWVRAIAEKAPKPGYPNITLRGPFTQKVLEHYGLGHVGVPLGCPSLFTSGERELGKKIAANFRKPKRVAVAAGNYHMQGIKKLEASLIQIVTETHGVYISQHPLGMNRAMRNDYDGMTDWEKWAMGKHILPGLSVAEQKRWLKLYGRVYYNIDAWIEELRHADFVIGPRIHGVLLGLQAGVPSVCLAIDSRTQELCETMKVPWVPARKYADGIALADLERLFNFDPEEFDRNRHELAQKYVSFLEHNRIRPAQWLKDFSI